MKYIWLIEDYSASQDGDKDRGLLEKTTWKY